MAVKLITGNYTAFEITWETVESLIVFAVK